MTLTSLLELKTGLLQWGEDRGLILAESVWTRRGRPTAPGSLADALEEAITSCTRNGILYPAFLLKRKKQLDRREWSPVIRTLARKQTEEPISLDACPDCAGRGIIVAPGGGSGSLCLTCLGTGKQKPIKQEK